MRYRITSTAMDGERTQVIYTTRGPALHHFRQMAGHSRLVYLEHESEGRGWELYANAERMPPVDDPARR